MDKTQGGWGIRIVGKFSRNESGVGKFDMKLTKLECDCKVGNF